MKGWSREQKRHWIILCLQQSGRMQVGQIRGWAHTGVWKDQRWLTNEVGQQKQEHYRDEDGTEGSTFPVAVLVGLLQAEGRTGESIPRQWTWGWRVHCARGQRVSWRRCAIHWWCSTWFEQELPGGRKKISLLLETLTDQKCPKPSHPLLHSHTSARLGSDMCTYCGNSVSV